MAAAQANVDVQNESFLIVVGMTPTGLLARRFYPMPHSVGRIGGVDLIDRMW